MKDILAEVAAVLQVQPACLAGDIEGFTSRKVRKLLNLLVAQLPKDEIYFEVGCLRGATLVSALLGHRAAMAHACDNWSQFKEWEARAHFHQNLKTYGDRLPDIVVHEEDCFELARRRPFRGPIGIYFYDGDHSHEAQRRAILEFAPHFSREVIVLVDDWNWDAAKTGTRAAIEELKPQAVTFREFTATHNGDVEGFWNGIGAFHLKLR